MSKMDYKQTELFKDRTRKGPVLNLLEELTSEVGYIKLKQLAKWLDRLVVEQRQKDQIRFEFFEMRRSGVKTSTCTELMCEKYGLSEDNLNQIIYPRL